MVILKKIDKNTVAQSLENGYINCTSITKACNKKIADYIRLKSTKEFLKELESVMGIPITELIRTVQGGNPRLQGTWVHPDVAVNLAYWASPKFAIFVSKLVNEWRYKKSKTIYTPHLKRYNKNVNNIPKGYFSIINEVYLRLFSKMEDDGIHIPKEIMPDISVGRRFSDFLREKKVNVDNFPTYKHSFIDKRPDIDARLYPNKYLPDFLKFFEDYWVESFSTDYFKKRLPKAIEYISNFKRLEIS